MTDREGSSNISKSEYKFPDKNYKLDEEFADYVKSHEGKHITKEEGFYIVSREIKGKKEIFGMFSTLEFARMHERNLIINSWNAYFPPYVSPYGKYLTKKGDKFYISRTVKGQERHYGTFDNLSDAIERREELIENNWNFKKPFKIRVRYDPNIYFSYATFKIKRRIDRKWEHFGKYDSYEDALLARDILIESNWDSSNIPEILLSPNQFIEYTQLGVWEVNNTIDDVSLSFGLFDNYENARKAVNILRDNDWNTAYVPLEYYAEDSGIRKFRRKKGTRYAVVRRINGEVKEFASFDHKSDAIEFRDKLHFNNWEIEEQEIEEKYDEYIYQVGDKKVVKKDGVVYGEFDRICDAVDFRLECIKKNWRMDE